MAGKTTTTKKAAPRKASPAKAKKTKVVTVQKELPRERQAKPVFRTGTWLALVILAALITGAIYLNRQKESTVAEETPVSEPSSVFSAADGTPSSIEVKSADAAVETVKIARNAENAWAVVLPIEAEADQGLAEAAASQVSALQVVSPIEGGKPEVFGLDKPAYVITIEFASGKKHTLEVGDSTPTNSGYYVRIDKDKIVITGLSGIDSLLQLGFFPPYLSTPVPEVPVTPTP